MFPYFPFRFWIRDPGSDNCVLSMNSKEPLKSWESASCTMFNRWICELDVLTWPHFLQAQRNQSDPSTWAEENHFRELLYFPIKFNFLAMFQSCSFKRGTYTVGKLLNLVHRCQTKSHFNVVIDRCRFVITDTNYLHVYVPDNRYAEPKVNISNMYIIIK